jgi:hypothetical protein
MLAYLSDDVEPAQVLDWCDGVAFSRSHDALVGARTKVPRPKVLVVDTERYKPLLGRRSLKDVSAHLLGDAWDQMNAEADVLLSPGLLPKPGDPDGFKRGLEDFGRFVGCCRREGATADVFAVTVLSDFWLTEGSRDLLGALDTARVPLAVVLAGSRDVLSDPRALQTYLQIIEVSPQFIALRGDVSAIGAMCFGARFGVVGTRSSVRHIFLPVRKPKGRIPSINSAFFSRTMTWINVEKLDALDDEGDFDCPCDVCGGLSILRFADEVMRDDLAAHNIAAVNRIARNLMAAPPVQRPSEWVRCCDDALAAGRDLTGQFGLQLGQPAALKAWSQLAVPTR